MFFYGGTKMQDLFQRIAAFFMSILAFFTGLFGWHKATTDPVTEPTSAVQPTEEPTTEPVTEPTTEPFVPISVFQRDVIWGDGNLSYYHGLQADYNTDGRELDFSYVRGYPEMIGAVSEGGQFILDPDDGGESIVFIAEAGKTYTVSTGVGTFHPGYHGKYGRVDTMDVATGTRWYGAVDILQSWNGKASVTFTPDFSGICFVYLYNERCDELIGNVTVKESPFFNKDLSAARMYGLYDALSAAYPGYITKTDLGVCSDGVGHLYEYDFIPTGANAKTPKILIISGQHGFEKGSGYGVYYFFKDLCENYALSSTLDYFRNRVIFKIIPVVNPYGWDKYIYLNFNGVNLNRNYDNTNFNPNATGSNAGGAAPFDQPETAIVKTFVENNRDAVLLIDNHTQTGDVAVNMEKVNWIDTTPNQDAYYNRILSVCQVHLARAKAHFNEDYGLGLTESDVFGLYTNGTGQYDENFPAADAWATTKMGIIGLTFEGFNGFPGETEMYSDACLKANAELFGNFLGTFVEVYSAE